MYTVHFIIMDTINQVGVLYVVHNDRLATNWFGHGLLKLMSGLYRDSAPSSAYKKHKIFYVRFLPQLNG